MKTNVKERLIWLGILAFFVFWVIYIAVDLHSIGENYDKYRDLKDLELIPHFIV